MHGEGEWEGKWEGEKKVPPEEEKVGVEATMMNYRNNYNINANELPNPYVL